MRWTILHFGKHKGRSLPEIILFDVDYFFWAFNKGNVFQGGLANEAAKLLQRARAIRIPKPNPKHWQVEYSYDDTGGFSGFCFVKVQYSIVLRLQVGSFGAASRSVIRSWAQEIRQARLPKSSPGFSASLFWQAHPPD
jgi:hypothetical protein